MQKRNSVKRVFTVEKLERREVLTASLPVGADLITNGEFESLAGDVATDWTDGGSDVPTHDFVARSERGFVALVSSGNSLTQTVDVVSGQKYVLTFDYRLAGTATDGDIIVNDGDKTVTAVKRWQTAATTVDATGSTFDIKLSATGDIFVDSIRLTPVEEILLENGDFETSPLGVDSMFSSSDLAGWNSVGDRSAKNLNLKRVGGSNGDALLNLDGSADLLDRIFQEIATDNGQRYVVTFDLKGSASDVFEENELRVRWNDQFFGAFDGDSDWQSFGFIAEAGSDTSRLLFREVGDLGKTGDGEGPYIDNVEVFRILPGRSSLTVNEPDTSAREFTENQGPVSLLSAGLTLDNTVDGFLSGAVVTIQNMLDTVGSEFLNVDLGATGIQADYDATTGRLRLSGRHSVADYQQVLKTLTYDNLSETPDETQRKIRVTIDYRRSVSIPVVIDVNVTAVNDRPTLRPIQDQSVTVLTSLSVQVDASDVETPGSLTYSISATGTAIGSGDAGPTISDSGLIEWVPQQSGNAEFTVTVEDPSGDLVRRTFTVTATLDATVPSNFAPFSGTRQLSNVVPSLRNDVYSSAPSMNIDLAKEYRAIIHTDDGDIEILLYDNDTPVTVNNFINLARDGYFDGLTFQRVVSLIGSFTEGFIAQGGDPLGNSSGGPGYSFGDENLAGSVFDKPVIAMANSGVGTSTNGSNFFLTYDDKVTHLNGNHTIFGEITSGLNVVQAITKRAPGSPIPAEVIRKITIQEI